MQFDPGMEYRPDWGDGKGGERLLRAGHSVVGGPGHPAAGGGKKPDSS